jgi:hypothetical protein
MQGGRAGALSATPFPSADGFVDSNKTARFTENGIPAGFVASGRFLNGRRHQTVTPFDFAPDPCDDELASRFPLSPTRTKCCDSAGRAGVMDLYLLSLRFWSIATCSSTESQQFQEQEARSRRYDSCFRGDFPRGATMTEQNDVLDFEPEQFVNAYRVMIGLRDGAALGIRGHLVATINLMRQKWTIWHGEDSLHELAFGQPVK